MDMQNVSNLQIPEGDVRTIHDKDNRLIWGRLAYDTKYVGNTIQNGTPAPDTPIAIQTVTGGQIITISDGIDSEAFPISLGSIELCKIGDYQDYIYKSGDDWYVYKEVGKDVLPTSGYTLWSTHTDACMYYRNYEVPNALFQNGSTALLCKSFVCKAQIPNLTEYYNNYHNDGYGLTLKTQTHGLAIQNIDQTTITDFHTWISNNPITLYYALATPTDIKITDATLIGQLNAVHEWLTRYGYNAIVTGNLPLIVDRTNL